MREPSKYRWWFEGRWGALVQWLAYQVGTYTYEHSWTTKTFPRMSLYWLDLMEWSIGRTMNDGPDEYYLSWRDFRKGRK